MREVATTLEIIESRRDSIVLAITSIEEGRMSPHSTCSEAHVSVPTVEPLSLDGPPWLSRMSSRSAAIANHGRRAAGEDVSRFSSVLQFGITTRLVLADSMSSIKKRPSFARS